MPLPYGSGGSITQAELMDLTPSCYQRVVRAVAVIPQKTFARNSNASGAFVWWFGITSLIRGDSTSIRVGSHLGFTPSYEALREFWSDIYKRNKEKNVQDFFNPSLLVQPAWENIDSGTAKNNSRAIGDNRDFYGTVLTASQMEGTKPIYTPHQHSIISLH